jgi:hypothetical protein
VTAARAGEFAAAVRLFEAARAAGLDTSALHFNLGVAYYRSGRPRAARDAFQAAYRRGGMAAPAAYNLGRLALERGNRAAARRWFTRARDHADGPRLREQAQARLAELGERPRRAVSGTLRLGAGVDTNPAADPEPTASSARARDAFQEGSAYAIGRLGGGWFLDGFAYAERYRDAKAFDLLALSAGGGWDGGGERRPRLSARLRELRLGGDPYERALLLEAERRWPRGDHALEAGIEVSARDGRGDFAYLDGRGYRAGLAMATPDPGLRAEVAVERVAREDFRRAGDFFSFSWLGATLEVRRAWRAGGSRRLEVTAGIGRRAYDDPERRAGETLGARDAWLLDAGVSLSGRLAASWGWRTELLAETRDSGVGRYDYDRLRLSASLAHRF